MQINWIDLAALLLVILSWRKPCCPPLLPAEDPRWYFAMSTPGDTHDALSDITNIAGIYHTISWSAHFLMSFHSCHLSWLCVRSCYDEEINNLAYYLPCTTINFTDDGILGGHFEEPYKRMF